MERFSIFTLPKTEQRDPLRKVIFDITPKKAENTFVLNWEETHFDVIEINVSECVTFDVLEFTSLLPRKIILNLEKESRVIWKTVHLLNEKSSQIHAHLREGASIDMSVANFSEGTQTVEAVIDLVGDFSRADWNLAALSYNQDQKDIRVSVNHYGKNTHGLVSNYGVVQGSGYLKFSGTSHIMNGSHQSRTRQNAKIMVFDPRSVGRADPILKIDENDVEASHAAAVGKVNDEHLFYLCSRGLDPQEAKHLITMGYLKPIIQKFTNESVKEQIETSIMGRI